MNPLPILYIRALMHRNNISKSRSKIMSDNFVHSDFQFLTLFVGENNTNSVPSLLSLYVKEIIEPSSGVSQQTASE